MNCGKSAQSIAAFNHFPPEPAATAEMLSN
jgi:hypothetical protein